MWLEDRHGVELRNHTTGKVFVDKLFLKNSCVSKPISKAASGNHKMTDTEKKKSFMLVYRKGLALAKKFVPVVEWSLDKFQTIINGQKKTFCSKPKNSSTASFTL